MRRRRLSKEGFVCRSSGLSFIWPNISRLLFFSDCRCGIHMVMFFCRELGGNNRKKYIFSSFAWHY